MINRFCFPALLACLLVGVLQAGVFHIHAAQKEIRGLRIGSSVAMLGATVGKIEGMEYTKDGCHIDLRITINEDRAKQILTSTYASLTTIENNAAIEILRRSDLLGVHVEEVDRGLKILRVFEGTGSDRIGLKVDDIIRSINSVPVRSFDQWDDFCGKAKKGDTLRVRVLRNGKEGTQIGIADMANGMQRLGEGEKIPFIYEPAASLSAANQAAIASSAVKKAADGFLPQIKGTLDAALEMGNYIVDDVQGLMDGANELMEDDVPTIVKQLHQSLDGLQEALDKITPKVATTLEDYGKIGEKVDGLLADVDVTLNRVTPMAESTVDDYDRIGQKVESLLVDVERLMATIEYDLQPVPRMINTTDKMLCQSAEMVNALRNHWLVRRVIDRQCRRGRRR